MAAVTRWFFDFSKCCYKNLVKTTSRIPMNIGSKTAKPPLGGRVRILGLGGLGLNYAGFQHGFGWASIISSFLIPHS